MASSGWLRQAELADDEHVQLRRQRRRGGSRRRSPRRGAGRAGADRWRWLPSSAAAHQGVAGCPPVGEAVHGSGAGRRSERLGSRRRWGRDRVGGVGHGVRGRYRRRDRVRRRRRGTRRLRRRRGRHGPTLAPQARFQTRLHRGPFVDEHAEDDGVAEGAVLPLHVAPDHPLAAGAEPGDGGLGAGVQQVGLQLDPAVPAVLEAVREEQQLGLGVDRRAPPPAAVERRAEVDALVDQVRLRQGRRPDQRSRPAEIAVGDETDRVGRASPTGRRPTPARS